MDNGGRHEVEVRYHDGVWYKGWLSIMQPLIAVQGSGQLSFVMTMKRQKFFPQIKMCGRPKLVE